MVAFPLALMLAVIVVVVTAALPMAAAAVTAAAVRQLAQLVQPMGAVRVARGQRTQTRRPAEELACDEI